MSEPTVLSRATLEEFGIADESELSHEAKAVLKTREMILGGKSAWGDPNSHVAQQKLAEINARLEYGQQQGTIPQAKPWTPARVAEEKLAADFPSGPPSGALPEHLHEFTRSKLDALGASHERTLANLRDEVLADITHRATPVSARRSKYDPATSSKPHASDVINGLLEDAGPAITSIAKSPEDADRIRSLLRADRTMLEQFAERGQAVAIHQARKKALGA